MPGAVAEPPPVGEEVDAFGGLDQAMAEARDSAMSVANENAEITKQQQGAEAPVEVGAFPEFVQAMIDDYQSSIAHVFVIHGNISDYTDSKGSRSGMPVLLSAVFDSNYVQTKFKLELDAAKTPAQRAEVKKRQDAWEMPTMPRIFCYYTLNNGLVFPDQASRELWESVLRSYWKDRTSEDQLKTWLNPGLNIHSVMASLNATFEATKGVAALNRTRKRGEVPLKEMKFTVAFFNGNYVFPNGPILHLQADRSPVGYVYNWAQDDAIADRGRIVIITPSLEDIHETIRGGDSGISAISIKRPNLQQREQWLIRYNERLSKLPEGDQPMIGGVRRNKILYKENEVDPKIMAVQAAGLNFKQMEQVIRKSWRTNSPIDLLAIQERKKRASEDQWGGLIEVIEAPFGFDHIGGHEHLIGTQAEIKAWMEAEKKGLKGIPPRAYLWRQAILPLRAGDRKKTSKGVLFLGPPGTGKTKLAVATSYHAKIPCVALYPARLFDGIVGGTEKKTRAVLELLDSMAPVIVWIDELESALGGGRVTSGDSNTGGRMFNSIMTWLSDDSRVGRIFVMAATNRPDLLDKALIREGRFDARVPLLPPAPNSEGTPAERVAILKAIMKQLSIRMERRLADTVKTRDNGLGRLLYDSRIWTGAQMRVLLQEALDYANYADRETLDVDDFNEAFNSVEPNSEIQDQIDLALGYKSSRRFVPPGWEQYAADPAHQRRAAELHESEMTREF